MSLTTFPSLICIFVSRSFLVENTADRERGICVRVGSPHISTVIRSVMWHASPATYRATREVGLLVQGNLELNYDLLVEVLFPGHHDLSHLTERRERHRTHEEIVRQINLVR